LTPPAIRTVKAEPYDYLLPAKEAKDQKIALVVIDMQADFVQKGGFGEALGNDVSLLQDIIPNVKATMEKFRKLGLPIIHTREGHKPDLSDCPPSKLKRSYGNPLDLEQRLQDGQVVGIGDGGSMGRILVTGEPGNDIIPECAPIEGEIVIDKPGKGAFYATDLDLELKKMNVTHLAFAGVTTEVCVQTSMREANDRGYESILVEDCTESYFPHFKKSTIEMIKAQGGIVGWVSNSEDLMAGLEVAYATGAVSKVDAQEALVGLQEQQEQGAILRKKQIEERKSKRNRDRFAKLTEELSVQRAVQEEKAKSHWIKEMQTREERAQYARRCDTQARMEIADRIEALRNTGHNSKIRPSIAYGRNFSKLAK